MSWFTTNWFWILIFIAFIGMHMFGHGGHGRRSEQAGDKSSDAPGSAEKGRSGGHRH